MNKQRRKDIQAAIDLIEKARALIEEAKEALEMARDEEQEYYDDMPDNFRNGDRGESASAAIDSLESAISEIENIDLESITCAIDVG